METTKETIVRYSLLVNHPGSDEHWQSFDSRTPFLSIHEGDIVDPMLWEGSRSPKKVLRVTSVRHQVWRNTDGGTIHRTIHTIEVFTEEIENSEELYLKRAQRSSVG